MFFIDWPFWRELFIALAVVVASLWLVKKSLRWKVWNKVVVFVAALPLAGIAALALLFSLLECVEGCNSYSPPLYSPGRKAAARIDVWDAGATGGGTNVRVFRYRGFVSDRVFSGNWESVEGRDIVWVDDRHLIIGFTQNKNLNETTECSDAGDIRVTCVPH